MNPVPVNPLPVSGVNVITSKDRFQNLLGKLGVDLGSLAAHSELEAHFREIEKLNICKGVSGYSRDELLKELHIDFEFGFSDDVLRRLVILKRVYRLL